MSTSITGPNGVLYTFTGKGQNCTIAACPIEDSVYGYRPDLGWSCGLIALYALAIIICVVKSIRHRTGGYAIAFVLGCIDEILGYLGRILYWQDPWRSSGFIMQIVLITIGPVFFSAAIYVMLYKITMYISPSHSRFEPKLFYYIFVPCDVVSLVLQAAGGAISSTSFGASNTGVDIALAGLCFQVATLTLFVGLAIDYAIRSRPVWSRQVSPYHFRVFVIALSGATILLLLRCCYRVYELSQGYSMTSKALRNQGEFIGLESVPILVMTYLLLVAHPGRVFDKEHDPESVVEKE